MSQNGVPSPPQLKEDFLNLGSIFGGRQLVTLIGISLKNSNAF
jgi:hypothetical protein